MTVAYPYTLASFANRLPIAAVEWDIKRRDVLSGQGSGRIWQAELAPPLWTGRVELDRMPSSEAKQIAALVRKLHGAQEAFYLYDPLSMFPQADPRGIILGTAEVKVETIPSHRASMSLEGLPSGYDLTLGDKLTITYGSDPVRVAFLEISETASAGQDGTTGLIGVFPHIPIGVSTGAIVRLKLPYCKCVIMPDSHCVGRARRHLTEGAGFTAIEKL